MSRKPVHKCTSGGCVGVGNQSAFPHPIAPTCCHCDKGYVICGHSCLQPSLRSRRVVPHRCMPQPSRRPAVGSACRPAGRSTTSAWGNYGSGGITGASISQIRLVKSGVATRTSLLATLPVCSKRGKDGTCCRGRSMDASSTSRLRRGARVSHRPRESRRWPRSVRP